MKKNVLLLFLICLFFLTSCAKTVIPNSAEAESKMKDLGYTVTVKVHYGEDVKTTGITQMTLLNADKDDAYIQVYYFTNEEDTETFYRQKGSLLSKDVEVLKKNKYSIYRGSKSAVADFLG